MNITKQLAETAARIRTLARTGLTYALNEYDTERYRELDELSMRILALLSERKIESVKDCFVWQKEYVTPKVDIRAVVFNEKGQILLVREKSDGRWSLPGGWADVGYSPREVAVKEVKEETGLEVAAVRLLAVTDQKSQPHPPALHYAYKFFILCEICGGEWTEVFDILDKGFFDPDCLPLLSEERVLESQIRLMYEYRNNPCKPVWLD